MKTIRDFRFSLLVLLYAIIIVLFTSYGNKKVHPDLNTLMVDAFLKRNKLGDLIQSDFAKYTFYFEAGITLKGTTIVKDGFFNANDIAAAGFGYGYCEEGSAVMTPQKWISSGGYSADVPEVPASLRHFYDPTRSPGDRYLTDITNGKIMGSLQKYVLTNPHMDGVEWALGLPGEHSAGVQEHNYTWERGKQWMQMALKETNQDKKNEYMAQAWRSLGETLHMIADNGCPPHVRNDAHPSPIYNNNTWFGNADPYEEFIDIIRNTEPSVFTEFAKGLPDESLRQLFRQSTKANDIAHALAVFTNKNFVTNETISGTDRNGKTWKQTTHPDYSYTSPLLEKMTYDDAGYTYSSSMGVLQCADHYYFAKLIPKICDPFVNIECVKSQASVLIPNIIEAGANVIKLYIPKLAIEIKSIEKGFLQGEIKHKTDAEYPNEIKYAGEVLLTIKDKNFREVDKIKVEARNGKFETEGIKLSKEERLLASIEFGGITVESSEFMGTTDNILGIYQGDYTMTFNAENMLEHANDMSLKSNMEADQRLRIIELNKDIIEMEVEKFTWIKGGGQGGPIVKFQIGKTNGMENYYETKGLKYFVYNLSNTAFIPQFLTPLVDKSNAGTTLVTESNRFTCTVESNGATYTIKASFNGSSLVGDWKYTYKGKVLHSATFSARKIVQM